MAKNLTEKQEAFLDAFFGPAKGDAFKAKLMAGYSEQTKTSEVVKPLMEELHARTVDYLALNGTRAAIAMIDVLKDPTALGNKEKMQAAKDIMDRAGFQKTEKVEVKSETPLFILPEKRSSDE
jgi:hypothetical protein